jgi:hypothetical protein
MDDVSVVLATIEAALSRLGREALLQSLQSGLPADAVWSTLDSTGLASTPDLEAVYFYVVDLGPTGAGAVRHFWIDEAEHPVEYSSLGAMMATLAQGYERGIFSVDPDGYLEMDDLVFGGLTSELNPDVAYWRELT